MSRCRVPCAAYSRNCARGYLRKVLPVLGLVPVRDGPRTAASPLKSGHHVAPPVPRKGKTPKETTQGGRAGARGTTEESTKTQNPFPPFVCSPLCGVATPRVLRTLLRVDFLLEEVQGRGLPRDLVHGLSPTFSRRSFREEASLGTFKLKRAAPVRPPSGRILRR